MSTQNRTTQWLGKQDATVYTHVALEHYTVYRQLVLQKLKCAQKANLAMKLSDNPWIRQIPGVLFVLAKLPASLRGGDEWSSIIKRFSERYIGEADLKVIETILERMPARIKSQYEENCRNDPHLQKLRAILKPKHYREAMQHIREVHAQPNPITGLTDGGYDEGFLDALKSVLSTSE